MANYAFQASDKGDYVWLRPESFPDVVPVLVDLAGDPNKVASDTDSGFALRISHEVFQRFLTYVGLTEGLESTPDAGNVDAPAPKKRGRPRKNPLPDKEG